MDAQTSRTWPTDVPRDAQRVPLRTHWTSGVDGPSDPFADRFDQGSNSPPLTMPVSDVPVFHGIMPSELKDNYVQHRLYNSHRKRDI